MIPAIQVENLHRHFGQLRAVDGVSFEIPAGCVCGFIGSNGAGKTTAMRILATLDYPTHGNVRIGGVDVVEEPWKVRHRLGWMPDHFHVYAHMSVTEFIDFHARALGFRGAERRQRVTEVMEFTDLAVIGDRPADKLSKGMTQRLCLGRALIHDPEVLILDEPAAGLDPKARVELKHLIRLLADEGKTIFISSHILSELGEMCDSLVFINHGKIVHHGDAQSLLRHTESNGGILLDVQLAADPAALAHWCRMQPNLEFVETTKSGGRLRMANEDPVQIAALLARMIKDGLPVIEFHREQRNLEAAFMEMVSRTAHAPPPLIRPASMEQTKP
ncbi:MAG: ABC transporter ATP-binding protein [Akkermansiaceae bacterium]|nr:ABC transporter ATP-binding protein [Akkermansiaceae bacterium]MCF7733843.1 ABC transporter ATP-binding protein [Akkermansiaceae bacterium]